MREGSMEIEDPRSLEVWAKDVGIGKDEEIEARGGAVVAGVE